MILQREFFERDSAIVARQLLGQTLFRKMDGKIRAGIINQVEAYFDHNDSASHASKGQTKRNAVMFGPAGFAYVYFIYGMYNMFNIVTEQDGRAGAVLIRSVCPTVGIDSMIRARHDNEKHIADGPGKLCQAFQIDRSLNGRDLTLGADIWLEQNALIPESNIFRAPRVGIDYAHEKDKNALLRFSIVRF